MNFKKLSILLAAGLLLAGCGGSSKNTLSKAQLAAKVNGYCSAYNKAVNAIPAPSDFFQNPVHAAAYLNKIKPFVLKEYDQVAALKPANDVKADFQALVAANAQQRALFLDALAKAEAKDASGIKDVQQAQTHKQNVIDPLLRKLGFTACIA